MPVALLIARAVEGYLLVGIAFATWFARKGAARLDPVASHGTWGFRVAITPAAIALWPLLGARLIRAQRAGASR